MGSFFSSLKDDEKRKKIVGEAGRKGSGIENGDGSCEMVGEGGRKKGLDHTASVFFFFFSYRRSGWRTNFMLPGSIS